jgi:hypothetical protein
MLLEAVDPAGPLLSAAELPAVRRPESAGCPEAFGVVMTWVAFASEPIVGALAVPHAPIASAVIAA